MITAHRPATPPWRVIECRAIDGVGLAHEIEADGQTVAHVYPNEGENAAYIVHACNAYSGLIADRAKLIAALRSAAHTAISGMDGDANAACDDIQADTQALLCELGEV